MPLKNNILKLEGDFLSSIRTAFSTEQNIEENSKIWHSIAEDFAVEIDSYSRIEHPNHEYCYEINVISTSKKRLTEMLQHAENSDDVLLGQIVI